MMLRRFTFWLPNPDWTPFVPLGFKAWWKGRRDGRLGIPPLDDECFAPFEHRLKQKTDYAIRNLVSHWQRRDGQLHEAYCAAELEHAQGRERIARLEALEQTLAADQQSARQSSSALVQDLRLPLWLHLVLMTALGLSELPTNALVFRIFGQGTRETYFVASVLALGVPLAAELVGRLLRRRRYERRDAAVENAFVVATGAAVLLVLGGLAYLRTQYIASTGSLELFGMAGDRPAVTITFLFLNLLLFLVGVMLAFAAYHPELASSRDVLAAASRSAGECRRALAQARDSLEEVERRRSQLRARRVALRRQLGFRTGAVEDYMHVLLEVYRERNFAARAARGEVPMRPRSFRVYPQVTDRARLPAELDWSCSAELAGGTAAAAGERHEEPSAVRPWSGPG